MVSLAARSFRRGAGILLAACLATPACAVRGWSPVGPVQDRRPRVHVGDHVRVSGAAGVVELVVTGGVDPVVWGRPREGGKPVEVDLRDFDRVEVRRVEVWPTVAVNAFGVALATLATLAGYYFLLTISE